MTEEKIETKLATDYELLNKIREVVNEDVILKSLDDEYGDRINEMLSYNEFNIKEKIEINPFVQKEFRIMFHKEMSKLEKAKDLLDKMIGEKYQSLREGEVTLTKREIEQYYIPSDPNILKARGGIRKQETKVKYFETISKCFEQQLWGMKTWESLSKGGW